MTIFNTLTFIIFIVLICPINSKIFNNTENIIVIENRLNIVEQKISNIEHEFYNHKNHIDIKFDIMNHKFDIMNHKFESMEQKFNSKFTSLEDRINSKFTNLEDKFSTKFDFLENKITIGQNEFRNEFRELKNMIISSENRVNHTLGLWWVPRTAWILSIMIFNLITFVIAIIFQHKLNPLIRNILESILHNIPHPEMHQD